MNVLQLTAHFSPNIGGVETHLDDLVEGLVRRKHQVTVLTYKPLSVDIGAPFYAKKSGLEIIRIPWIKGLFYILVEKPILEFLYLVPGLFFSLPVVLLRKKYHVIHAHGLVAATVGVFWAKIFGVRIVASTHSLYHFPKSGLYRNFVKWVLNNVDVCLCLSKKSIDELKALGINNEKIKQFVYWIDLHLFKPLRNENLKQGLGLENRFICLFVGRLVEIKGVKILLKAFKQIRGKATLVIAGDGPLRDLVIKEVQQNGEQAVSKNRIRFAGRLGGQELVKYYNLCDLLVVPSIHDEGFGRVILESLACGTPVLGSDRGSIPEAMDLSVGKLVKVDVQNLKKEITYLKNHQDVLKKLEQNTRAFALKKYSEKNINVIIKSYIGN